MNKTLGIVHTSATLVPVFQELCNSKLPDISVFHIADDSLIKDVIRKGKLTPQTAQRVARHIFSAEDAGADRILVTCSSIGRAVEAAMPLTGVPVLRVDQPMTDQAVTSGKRIGVIATLPTTLDPTADLVRRRAGIAGKSVEIREHLCEGAFEALMGGQADIHDDMVSKALVELAGKVDVILLAQASMARVAEQLGQDALPVPILSSPVPAIDYLAAQFAHE